MPDNTWVLVFERRDGEYEECEHALYKDARDHLNLFDESDGDIYERIKLIERNWKTDTDTLEYMIEF